MSYGEYPYDVALRQVEDVEREAMQSTNASFRVAIKTEHPGIAANERDRGSQFVEEFFAEVRPEDFVMVLRFASLFPRFVEELNICHG